MKIFSHVTATQIILKFFRGSFQKEYLNGKSYLSWYVYHRLYKSAHVLLESGADVHGGLVDSSRAWGYSIGFMKLMLDHGADINEKNELGEKALHFSGLSRDGEHISFLLRNELWRIGVLLLRKNGLLMIQSGYCVMDSRQSPIEPFQTTIHQQGLNST
eukprot:TRINITY_DN3141_c3_g2_i1.p1 TRINITY_DN3141_c3_g2~~TRINITY_DN3141_c3_g2_i1.p1  ORF type:complete len:159 (+),score=13.73 TRINITY_DN3141_c3_g2_i1:656-1132(+)